MFSAASAAVRCKLMIFVATVSLEALRGGRAEFFTTAPVAVRCKLKIFVDTVSLEALRGGGGVAQRLSVQHPRPCAAN